MHTKSSAHFLWMVLFTTAMQECKNEFAHSAAAVSRFDIDLPYKMGKSSWNTLYVESFTYASSFNYPNNNDRMIARLSQKAAAIVCKLDVRFVERNCWINAAKNVQ